MTLGRFKEAHLIVETSLEAEMTALEGEDKADVLRFLRRMLQWDPAKRASARALLHDPWLKNPPDDSESDDGAEEEEEGA